MSKNLGMRRAGKQRDDGAEKGSDTNWWYDSNKYLHAKHTNRSLDMKKKRKAKTDETPALG